MPEEINRRRRLLGATAGAIAASQFGFIGAAQARSMMPSFDGANAWLNSPPLTAQALRGKAVMVNFCTYSCINWIRSLPHVRAWAAAYRDRGLVTVGVHTPEFGFEKDLANVRRALAAMRVDWPIAVDNDRAIWRAFDNAYWPALYFADAQGKLRQHWFGEGGYEQSERAIQQLLGVAGSALALVSAAAHGVEAPASWDDLASPENYVGAARTAHFASPGGPVANTRHAYAAPARLTLNQWALAGDWTMGQEAIVLDQANGRIACRFHARDLHLVMGAGRRAGPARFRVLIDGQAPGAAHGLDVDVQGAGTVTEPRLYQLVRQPGPVVDRQFEVVFADPGVEAFAFTFG